jgi:hypothetical protein
MRETGEPTFVVSDCCWRARLRARGGARSRGSRVVSTHGLNTHRMSAVQKAWSSHVCATILLQHGPAARPLVLGSARGKERKKGLEPGMACRTSFVDGPAAGHRVDGHGRTLTVDGQGVTGVGPSELSWDVEESPGTMVNKGKSCSSVEVLKTMSCIDCG